MTRAGDVLFKLQDYAVHVATVPSGGGSVTLLATFQSETPSWHPDGRRIGITYGSWHRVIDDFHYPDIAQDVGIVLLDQPLPASAPAQIVSATSSEDQSLCWSPDGRFIAFTTDTARLQPQARGLPSWERPRERNAIILIGVDQARGEVRETQREVPLSDFGGQPLHVEWAPDSERLFFDSDDGGDHRSLNVVGRTGGHVTRLHAFESEQGFSGIGVSPDGQSIAFVVRARDGFYQIFVVPSTGGSPVQVTSDPTHKTQPAFSPDGKTIALTVWRYDELFLALKRR